VSGLYKQCSLHAPREDGGFHPPSGFVGNEPQRVSGEGDASSVEPAAAPPRRLVPRRRPSRREGEARSKMATLSCPRIIRM
jgi:hypothetical protein